MLARKTKNGYVIAATVFAVFCATPQTSSALCDASAKLIELNDGTIKETGSNTIWQKCWLGQNWNVLSKSCDGEKTKLTLKEAIRKTFAQRAVTKMAWRIPTIQEFSDLREYTCNNSNLPPTLFPSKEVVWTSTTDCTHDSTSLDTYTGAKFSCRERTDSLLVRLVMAGTTIDKAEADFQALFNQMGVTQHSIDAEEAEVKLALRMKIYKTTVESMLLTRSCDAAKRYVEGIQPLAEQPNYDHSACVEARRFQAIIDSRDPQAMYITAAQYEASDNRNKAKAIYLEITKRFPNLPVSMKAADRIGRLSDVEAVERSNSNASRDAANAIQDASRRAASRQEEFEANRRTEGQKSSSQCRQRKYSCSDSCSGIKNSEARSSCNSRCYSICSE